MLVLSTLFSIGCNIGGKDYVCDRPLGSPTDRGYVGELGGDGCASDAACVSEVGEGGGDCFTGAECILDGLNSGIGVSKDCALDEVCNVPDGAWYGSCEPWGETVDFEGSIDCEAPLEEPISIEQGEVISLIASFSPPENASLGANVGFHFDDSSGTVIYGGNPLGAGNAVYETAIELSLDHSFQYSDNYTLVSDVFECNPTSTVGSYERIYGPVQNTTVETAMPLAKGEQASGIIGCYDEDGAGNPQHIGHLYIIEASAGDVLNLNIEVDTDDQGNFGWLWLQLETESEVVLSSGNPVAVDTTLNASNSLDYTIEASGTYFLRLEQDYSRCGISTYTVSY